MIIFISPIAIMNDLKVLPVTGNILDVFWGEGWENWERMRKTKDKQGKVILLHLAGKQLPKMQKVKLYFSQSGDNK
jgi:hypothetical protein